MWHGFVIPSLAICRSKSAGTPTGLSISRQAPPSEILRTVQLIPPARLKEMIPALKTRCLTLFLFSIMSVLLAVKTSRPQQPRNGRDALEG
jgi:hypothetical protein